MSEDIINKNTSDTAAGGEPDTDAALNEELEQLKDTFQRTYDETAEEAEKAPVIQELEDGAPAADAEDDSEDENGQDKKAAPVKAQGKKKHKKLAIILPIVLCVLIVVPLLGFFVLSVTNPDFSTMVGLISKSGSAEEYSEKLGYYEQALELCADDGVFQKAAKQVIVDDIAKLMIKEKGYAETYSYITGKLTEEELASAGSAVKSVLKIADGVDSAADKALPLILEKLKADKEVKEDEIAKELSIPSAVKESFTAALSSLCEGAVYNASAKGLSDASVAVNYYHEAYSAFTGLGANSQDLCEKMSAALYANGYIFEAMSMTAGISSEAEPLNESYKEMQESIKEFASFKASVYDLAAQALLSGGDINEAALKLVSENCSFSDEKKAFLADIVVLCAEAAAAEGEHNLTKASSDYQTVLSVLELAGMSDSKICAKSVTTLFDLGNIPDSQTLAEKYITDEFLAAADEDFKEKYADMQLVFTALKAASDVFSPYFSEYYSSGTAIDFDKVSAELDALISDSSNAYDKGFVNYCKYYAAMYSDAADSANDYLMLMHEQIPTLPFVYGYYLMDYYIAQGDYDKAADFAQELLNVNIADDYSNSIQAFCLRVEGDTAASLAKALKGIELSGAQNYCAKQAAVAYMLGGDFENAYPYLKAMYTNSMSLESCDMLKVFNALYKGDNADIKEELETTMSEIENVYTSYGIESSQNTLDIISGEKTLADVFLSGSYELISASESNG